MNQEPYTITADGTNCFETDDESEAQEMLALLITHQQDEPDMESPYASERQRKRIYHELWQSEHPIAPKWAKTRVYEIKTTNNINE